MITILIEVQICHIFQVKDTVINTLQKRVIIITENVILLNNFGSNFNLVLCLVIVLIANS